MKKFPFGALRAKAVFTFTGADPTDNITIKLIPEIK